MGPPPDPNIDLSTTEGYRGNAIISLDAVMITLSTIIVGLRLYTRQFKVKRLGIDDLIAVPALGLMIALSVMDLRCKDPFLSVAPLPGTNPCRRRSIPAF